MRLEASDKRSRLRTNVLYQMAYELLILILPFVTSPYVSRILGASGLGEYSFHYSVAYYFVLFAMLGIRNYGNRIIAQTNGNRELLDVTFSGLLIDHVIISVLVLIVYIIYSLMFSENSFNSLLMAPLVISAIFDISWFYFGIEQFKITVSINSVLKVVTVALILLLVKSSEDLWIYILIMSGGLLVSQMALWIPLYKFTRLIRVDKSELLKHVKPLFLLFVPAIAISLYKYMDKIMIGTLASKVELGFYENAEKIINLPVTIIGSIGTVMISKVSSVVSSPNGKEKILYYIDISMDIIMCLGFGLMAGLTGIAQIFAPVFWGLEFAPCVILIRGLSLTIPFITFANIIRTQCLIPLEKDNEYMISIVSGAVINLILNSLLIPRIGSVGAMIGTISAESSVMIIQTFYAKRYLPVFKYINHCLPFLFVSIAMCIIVCLIGDTMGCSVFTLFVQIIVGGLFYCLISLFFLYRSENPIVREIGCKLLRKNNY